MDLLEKLTLGVAATAMVGTIGSFLTSVAACQASRDASRIASEAAERESSAPYYARFTMVKVRNGVQEKTPVNKSASPVTLPSDEAEAGTWITVSLSNIGNRTVSILDVGLVTDAEDNGYWQTRMKTDNVDCVDDSGRASNHDIRCYRMPVVLEVGESVTLHFPLYNYVDGLVEHDAAGPVVFGINTAQGSDYFSTALTIR